MSGFTPGPWRTKASVSQMCDEGTTVASLRRKSGTHWIFSDASDHGDGAADASLIAAAPELYEALESLTEFAAPFALSPESSAKVGRARAALAKAQGAQP